MATNKELVEQAVAAIPLWQAFLDQKEAEQDLILQQMQDEDTQYAPKSFTQKLTDRFRSTPEPSPQALASDEDSLAVSTGKDQVKLEKEARMKEEEEVVKETPAPQEPEPVSSSESEHEPVSSDDNKQQISKKDFQDLF